MRRDSYISPAVTSHLATPNSGVRRHVAGRICEIEPLHRLISEAIRGGRDDVVVHSKSGSPRYGRSWRAPLTQPPAGCVELKNQTELADHRKENRTFQRD
jgi:hypothetical protein